MALGPVAFDGCTDRSVLGSLNQMQFMLKARVVKVENVMVLNPLEVNRWLCHSPVSRCKAFWMPDEAMMERVARL